MLTAAYRQEDIFMNGNTGSRQQAGFREVFKRFLAIFLPVIIVMGMVMALIYRADSRTWRKMMEAAEVHIVELQRETIAADLDSVTSDLMFLSKNNELQELLDIGSPGARSALAYELSIFSYQKGIYDQVRFIDTKGMEVVRVNYNNGAPYVVDKAGLQLKADRYYFKEAMALGSGKIYVSPFDLNVEHGDIEEPVKPIIRFATPVFDSRGRRRGVLILNYLGEKIINPLVKVSVNGPGEIMLLNPEGYWLHSPRLEDEWGFMYADRSERTFESFCPSAWGMISEADSGQYYSSKGMFTFMTIYPVPESMGSASHGPAATEAAGYGEGPGGAGPYNWKIVSHVPSDALRAGSRPLLFRLLFIYGGGVFLAGVGSWLVSSAGAKRKIAEGALKESETRYRLVHDTSFDGIVISEADGTITETNPMTEKVFGYGPGELTGLELVRLIPVHLRERHLAGVRRFLETGERRIQDKVVELEGLRKNGEVFPLELAVSSFTVKGAVHFAATIRDITGRRSAEERLKKAHDALETRVEERTSELRTAYERLKSETDERKTMEEELLKVRKLESLGVLAGGIAHDFNNLLTGILGNISHARILSKSGDKTHKMLGEAEKASVRARDLTQQLLAFSRGGEPIKRTASVVELIRDSAEFALRGSNVNYEYSIPDDLWAVGIDEGQISQVINNLVINANQAMPEGGAIDIRCENVRIGIGNNLALKAGEYVLVAIEDHGCGISKENIQKIFDPYFTTKQKGSGLGLATSYAIIKNHDGLITVESELGRGTTFSIYLPATHEEIQEDEHMEAKGIRGEGRVLVMDDEEIIRDLVSEILTANGYEVDLTVDGAEAIERYKESVESGNRYCVVIMDLTIPGGMGGDEAIKALLEIDPDCKAIVSSGYSNDPIMADYRRHGFSGVISKPYRAVELSVLVHSVIEGDA
jgi:PAS domain S-box-containing protein